MADCFVGQSAAWGGILKILPRWYSEGTYAKIIGWFALSYGVGDALIRLLLGFMLTGVAWPVVFYICVGVSTGLALPCWFFIHASPTEIGESEPESTTAVEIVKSSDKVDRQGLARGSVWSLVKPLLASTRFWVVMSM